MTGMASGFFAILVSRRGAISTALVLVLVAILCDILDGKLARLLKASSRFGAELDSFADAISFGVAPGVILFESSVDRLGWLGGAASFFFAAMAVVRLARFNLDSSQQERHDVFRGFSTPIAAIYLVSFIVMRDALPAEVGVFYAVARLAHDLFRTHPVLQGRRRLVRLSRLWPREYRRPLATAWFLELRLVEPL